ncbi:MAG: GGDEF domain-containing protein [Proteobacteria bacterium]|nr:MAG: GGDEF domain-containing protein [Pseudomonadota bacterium]
MSLDLVTLHLIAALIGVLLGTLLIVFGREQKIPALSWWGTAYLLAAAAVGTWTLADPLLPAPVASAVSAIGFAACGLVWGAARIFHGRRPHWPGMLAGALSWCVLAPVLPPGLRLMLGVGVIASYATLTAWELGRERRRTLRRHGWPAAIVPLLHGFVLMLPVVVGDVVDRGGANTIWGALFTIELVLYAVGAVFVVVMLVSERTVRAHKTAAETDPLTGLLNRRGFAGAAVRLAAQEAKGGDAVSLLAFDLDHFKSINDRFGHPAGDEILRLFAEVLAQTLRATDIIGRVGGEEFCALLPCRLDEAKIAAERMRQAFESCGVAIDGEPLATTVSVGVAGGRASVPLEVLIAAADAALYRAKRAGRNCIEIAPEVPDFIGDRRAAAATGLCHRVEILHRPAPQGVADTV